MSSMNRWRRPLRNIQSVNLPHTSPQHAPLVTIASQEQTRIEISSQSSVLFRLDLSLFNKECAHFIDEVVSGVFQVQQVRASFESDESFVVCSYRIQ